MRKVMCCLTSVMVVVMLIGFSTGFVQAGTCDLPVFDDANFSSPQPNDYLPIPGPTGHTYIYEAEDEDGLIRDYQYFSTDTYVINVDGEIVTANVVYDVEWLWVEDLGQWRILEYTEDWHAWDNEGNFWYLGEDTEEYIYDDDWNFLYTIPAGSWEAGVDGALPGIILLADPHPGDCVQQEYYEDEAEDRGKVLRLNGDVSDYCDNDCLVTKEWTKLDPGNVEHKYYAPGVGLVYIEELKEKTVIFELVDDYSGPFQDYPPTDTPSL